MTVMEGVYNTTTRTGRPAELSKKSLAATLMRLFPGGSSPITGLSAMLGTTTAVGSTHGYFSKTVEMVSTTVGANYSAGAATISLASTAGMGVGSILHNVATRENMRVTAVNSATVVAVTKGFGRIADTTGTSGDKIILAGVASAENSNRPTARQFAVVYVATYTQIFRNAWALTGTAAASLAESGFVNVKENKNDAAVLHQIDQEAACIWGQAKMDTSGSQPIHTTQGIIDAVREYASSNYTTAASTTNLTQFVAMVENAFKYSTDLSNPRLRYGFGDAKAISVMNQIAVKNGTVNLTPETTEFGMDYQSFKCYKGTIRLMEHSLLNGFDPTAGRLIILDIPCIKLAYMNGRNAKVEQYGERGDIVENGVDGVGGSYTSEMALEILNPGGCAIIEGLTAGAAG